MAQSLKYTLAKRPTTTKPAVPVKTSSGVAAIVQPLSFGAGIVTPFQRDGKGDFANADDITLVRSNVRQVLYTIASSSVTNGEIPWRPEFGSILQVLRFRNLDETLEELARTYVVDSLKTWAPRIRITGTVVEADVDETTLDITVRYNILNTSRLSVVANNIIDAVQLPIAA